MTQAMVEANSDPATPKRRPPVEVRPARLADLPRILDLMRAAMGEEKVPITEAYWRWKHLENPFGASPCLLAISETGEPVGVRVFMRWAWTDGTRTIPAVRAVDTATHPAWQGRGIFSRLTRALLEQVQREGVGFVFNTPNRQSLPGYTKLGWRTLGRTDLWIRPRRPLRALKRMAVESPVEIPRAGQGSLALLRDPALERLLSVIPPPRGGLCTRRSLEYLRWRYEAVPGFEYRAQGTFRPGASAAVIWRTARRRSLNEALLGEVLVEPGLRGARACAHLLRSVARELDVDYLVAMAPRRRSLRAALILAGFLPAPRLGLQLTVRELGQSGASLTRRSLECSVGDLELF